MSIPAGAGMTHRVGLVVPCIANFSGLAELLVSARSTVPWTPYVIPNWRERHPVAMSWNMGIAQAWDDGCTLFLVVNDDVELAPQTIDLLVGELLTTCGGAGLVSAWNWDGAGDDWAAERERKSSPYPDMSCFLVSRETIEAAGWFDENFRPAYVEDQDYLHRCWQQQLPAFGLESAPIRHAVSKSLTDGRGRRRVARAAIARNHRYYAEKWGVGVAQRAKHATPYGRVDLHLREWMARDGERRLAYQLAALHGVVAAAGAYLGRRNRAFALGWVAGAGLHLGATLLRRELVDRWVDRLGLTERRTQVARALGRT